jgi:hypothetical protein
MQGFFGEGFSMIRQGMFRGFRFLAGFALASSLFGGGASAFAQDNGFMWYFGGWRPYGLSTSTVLPTPPYFSVFPPVYYGERYSRPYGVSPFAAMPRDVAYPSYQARPVADGRSMSNPYCCDETGSSVQPLQLDAQPTEVAQITRVRVNPFADVPELLADRQ